jgi:hypothetical protein
MPMRSLVPTDEEKYRRNRASEERSGIRRIVP